MLRFGMAAIGIVLVPTLLAAQTTDSTRMRDTSRQSGRRQQTSSGSVDQSSSSRSSSRLSHDQVTQLQTSLQQLGCDPGSVDGVMGTHTRSAERCARQKNNITSSDPQALYQSLNLNFASSDTGAVGSNRSHRSRGMNNGMRGDTSATSGTSGTSGTRNGMRRNGTRRGMRGDSTGRSGTTGRPDSTRRP
jgi:hypothetical protein